MQRVLTISNDKRVDLSTILVYVDAFRRMAQRVNLKMNILIGVLFNCYVCYANQDIWHSYQFDASFAREELVITDVITDHNFHLKKDVIAWKSLSNNGKIYAVGLLKNSVVVLNAKLSSDHKGFIISEKVTEFPDNLTDFEIFEHWNLSLRKSEIILILSTSSIDAPKLHWYMINDNDLNHFWVWDVQKNVTHMRFLQFDDDKYRLLILKNAKLQNFVMYEFLLSSSGNEFWYLHATTLSSPANTSALNFYGSDFYLSIPQKQQNEVKVYKLRGNHFEFYHRIKSNNVEHVSAFKIGFKSFLAVGGEEGGIYRFLKDTIESEEIHGLPLDDVDLWLPVPIKTYRDEVALISQRSLTHGEHQSFVLDVAVYDGQRFFKHDEFPCHYFGELMHGLDCMVNEEEHLGLFGATVFSLKDVLGILVPHKGVSVLYMVHSMLRSLKSPIELEIEKLMETRDQLQVDQQKLQLETTTHPSKFVETIMPTIEETSTSMALAHENVTAEAPLQDDLQFDIQSIIDKVEQVGLLLNETKTTFSTITLLNTTSNHINNLTLKGKLEVLGNTEIKNLTVDTINKEKVQFVLEDIVRRHHIGKINGQKNFSNLQVEKIMFETINNVDASEIVYNTDNPIIINGNIFFKELVNIGGEISALESINKLDLINEIVEMSKAYEEPLQFEHVKIAQTLNTMSANNVSIPKSIEDIVGAEDPNLDVYENDVMELVGNITVENVNGEHFDTFRKTICYTNSETYLSGDIFVEGGINVLESADIHLLNDLTFPDDYVIRNRTFVNISGKKNFENAVSTTQFILDGQINGVNPDTILTLTTNQSMPGKYIFNDFEANEVLDVEGKILGSYVDKLIPNPSLWESNVIDAKVIVNELEIDGVIKISNFYNNNNFQQMLQDVVYKNDPIVNITSIKNFTQGFVVSKGIRSLSGAINNIPLGNFVRTDSEQELLLKTLNGPVTFENLIVHGLYAGINITQLEEETVKLNGDQFVSAELIFVNENDDVTDISATEMEIVGTVNGLSPDQYGFKIPMRELNKIKAKHVLVEGNVFGTTNDFSLEDFEGTRLSASKNQDITGRYNIKNLYSNVFDAKTINGEAFEKFFNDTYCINKLKELLLSGRIKINKLSVNGSIFLEHINGRNVTDMMKNYLWSNQDNYFGTGVFQSDVFVSEIKLKYFNGIKLDELYNNLLFKGQPNQIINGVKTFTKGLHVTKMLNSEYLNNIYVDHILTKTGEQQIQGPLNIIGNVVIDYDCEIGENLNGVSVPYLTKTYKFVDDTIIINDDLVFNRLPYINNLFIGGYVNEHTLNDHFQNLVYKHQSSKILGNITFAKHVQFNNNIIVTNTINDVDLSDFVSDMVFITADDIVGGKVTFAESVFVEDVLEVDLSLDTKYLNGIDLDRWKNTAVFVNRGVIPGRLIFDSVTVQGNIYVNYINDIEMNSLIPLRTEQRINGSLHFYEISTIHNISVEGRVNGYVLSDEYLNTVLMSKSEQEVNSNVVFENNVMIYDNINTKGLVNDKNLSKVVTTNTEQSLEANFVFNSEIMTDSNIDLNGTMNNINITDWFHKSVKLFSEEPQIISDHWIARDKILFKENADGNGLINGLDVHNLADAMEEKRIMQINAESGTINNYVNMCTDVNAIMSIAENQIYLFKYLEILEIFNFGNDIENVHHFKAGLEDYLLVTEVNACASHLFIWAESNFTQIAIVDTGSISQMITVNDKDLVFLVGRSNKYVGGCRYSGANVWKVAEGNLIPLYKLDDARLLQESLVPGSFYVMTQEFVIEYHLTTTKETNIKILRKWNITKIPSIDNLIFVPRGLGTGLALSDGFKLYKLLRKSVSHSDYKFEIDAFVREEIVVEDNSFLPGFKNGNVAVINVGVEGGRKSLAAVATHEETSVKVKLDSIKIYEDVLTGKLFHKVPTYKPSSLISMEFGNNGETLLIFLEDEKVLQVYEYKGIEGFKHRSSVQASASKLISMSLPTKNQNSETYIVGLINKSKLTIIYAVMSGNKIYKDRLKCRL
ncbi:hypothetical protein FQR65_LT11939 [Abscondita terminalis]|nr:hypothetical protein FQR65_LT11939 [Abscondita terminalis]